MLITLLCLARTWSLRYRQCSLPSAYIHKSVRGMGLWGVRAWCAPCAASCASESLALAGCLAPGVLACGGDEVVLHALRRQLGQVTCACGHRLLDGQYLQGSAQSAQCSFAAAAVSQLCMNWVTSCSAHSSSLGPHPCHSSDGCVSAGDLACMLLKLQSGSLHAGVVLRRHLHRTECHVASGNICAAVPCHSQALGLEVHA